jgi:hypothetical protein
MACCAQLLLCAGLREIAPEDFKNAHFGLQVVLHCFLKNSWGHGPKPANDFFFNGLTSLGIELDL